MVAAINRMAGTRSKCPKARDLPAHISVRKWRWNGHRPFQYDLSDPTGTKLPSILLSHYLDRGETYEQDKAWSNRIEHGACSRLHDRTTDSLDDEAECDNDYAAQPLCVSYEGFALGWYDMASDPNPTVSSPANAMAALMQ